MYRYFTKFGVLFSAICILFNTSIKSQNAGNNIAVNEIVYIHLDKQVYVTGEQLNYKAYLVNTSGTDLPCSRILYFDLTGTGTGNKLSWRIYIDSSSAAGSLLIPEDLKPGMYMLTAYTNWMRNNSPSTFFSDRIMVVSLVSEESTAIRQFNDQTDIRNPYEKNDPNSGLRLRPEKSEFKTNESVKVEIDLNHQSNVHADLSISVNLVSPFDSLLEDADLNKFLSAGISRSYRISGQTACKYKIEDRGYILSGRIIGNPGTPSGRCDIWLSVTDSVSPRILYSKIDTEGEFRFYLDHTYDNKELIIQLTDPLMNSECKLEIFDKTAQLPDSITKVYNLDLQELNYLESVKNIRLVEAIYGDNKEVTEYNNVLTGPALLNLPNRVVIPSEYAEMRNFREIASNILPEVRFGTRHDEFFLELLSPNSNAWKVNNTVFLNGVPFTDLAYISTLGTKEIRRIEIIQPNILIGDITLPGLVSIYTYEGLIPENYLRRNTIRFQNTVMFADAPNDQKREIVKKGERYADFRNCLYWDPYEKISSGRKVIIEFPAMLLTGKFIIRAEGITADGVPLSAKEYFQITE